uniref:PKD_channel domain-containing protein n=1 Tax=Bursaphelenchus xylophilus TaxID=6326 RepID=A0A1I7S9C0_BURXY
MDFLPLAQIPPQRASLALYALVAVLEGLTFLQLVQYGVELIFGYSVDESIADTVLASDFFLKFADFVVNDPASRRIVGVLCNFIIICELFFLSILGFVTLAPSRNRLFDLYKNDDRAPIVENDSLTETIDQSSGTGSVICFNNP